VGNIRQGQERQPRLGLCWDSIAPTVPLGHDGAGWVLMRGSGGEGRSKKRGKACGSVGLRGCEEWQTHNSRNTSELTRIKR
jgi:hypothetical protein